MNDFFILTAGVDGEEIDPEVWFELLSDIWSELVFRDQLHQHVLRCTPTICSGFQYFKQENMSLMSFLNSQVEGFKAYEAPLPLLIYKLGATVTFSTCCSDEDSILRVLFNNININTESMILFTLERIIFL